MSVEIIESLYEYGVWANDRLLAKAAGLTDQERGHRYSRGYGSVHETFVHLLSADARWLARWQGVPLPPMLAPGDLPSLDAIRSKWAPVVEARRAYLAALREEDLHASVNWTAEGQAHSLPRWQAMLQCANHGTQHRSEIAAMLTDAGQSPGDLDYGLFCRQRT